MGRNPLRPRFCAVLDCGKGSRLQEQTGGTRGETRASGLWGARKGGGGAGGGRKAVKRGFVVLLLVALAAPFAAGARGNGDHGARSYLAPSLERAASDTPNAEVRVIVQSDDGAAGAQSALDQLGDSSRPLGIVDAAAGVVQAQDLTQLASQPGLVITPDNPVVLDTRHDNSPYGSDQMWTKAVGVDQLWPADCRGNRCGTGPRVDGPAPTIAFVDSGIQADRSDFGDRVRAQVDLTTLPDNSPGDGFGHGTLVAGLAAGSSPDYTGAAPTAGIVSLDVMDDEGMAKTSDVIRAAQWIQQNHEQYGIRVANFSLHSGTATSFRWDPLDKAVEKLWLSGVVVVASAGNYGNGGHPVRVGYAPANDPFVITVGALDIHNSSNPERADVPNWSTWGFTYDGFAMPEVSAPGRAIVGPVPPDSTIATTPQLNGHIVPNTGGSYMSLSGTSLSAPIVSGIVSDLLALRPNLRPDQVKGALMLSAQTLRKVRNFAAGVGEVSAPGAVAVAVPPNPNRGLDRFLVADPTGDGVIFDDAAWLAAARTSRAWNDVSWSDGWAGAAWSLVSWSAVSWSDVSWSDVSWSDVSWSDVSWSDVSWSDAPWWKVFADSSGDGG
jgi:serine protease AprX